MRPLGPVITLCAFSLTFAPAQTPQRTESQLQGYQGPVETAIIDVQSYGVEFEQPEGPGIVYSAGFRSIEFDHDGNMTKAGEILPNGKFFGEIIQNIRGGDGQLTQRIYTDFASGQLSHQDWFGPFGPTRSDVYIMGKLFQRSICTYEDHGHLSDCATLDANGTAIEERLIKRTDDGQVLQEASWGHVGGDIFYERINNQEESHFFQRWGDDGRLRLQTSTLNGKVVSFWSANAEPNQWGSTSIHFENHSDADRTSCKKGGPCITSHVHYEFIDESKKDPRSAEWRDSEGKVVYAAYYEYVYDSHKNWIHRDVWIVSPEHPDRTLYETDSRTITYWDR